MISNLVITTESNKLIDLLQSNIPEKSNVPENIVANNDICKIKPNPICALVEQLEEESHLLPGAGKPNGGPHTADSNPGAKPEAGEHENRDSWSSSNDLRRRCRQKQRGEGEQKGQEPHFVVVSV